MLDPTPSRFAYLTGHYPKASHTFIQREIAALRRLGVDVLVSAIRKPDAVDLIGAEEEAARAETFYVLAAAKNPLRLVKDHAALLARSPLRWFSTFGLALRAGRPGAKGLLWQLFYFAEAGIIAHWLIRERRDHLHNHFGDASANVAMLAAGLADIPFSLTLHGPAEFFAPEAWRLDEKIARARLVVCITHFARSQAMIFSDPTHWHKLRIVHCGVSPDRYDIGPPPDRPGLRLLFVGRLTQLKGLRVLFAALERLRGEHPDITLTVIGDGTDRAWAESEAHRIGGTRILGYRSQSDVAEALSEADVLVLPSFAEGLPVVFMEALAAGRPVIASRVAGVGELVEDGVTGRIVAPGDRDGLEAAIVSLAVDPEGRAAMGRAGQARVREGFDSDLEAAWLLQLFTRKGGDALRPLVGRDTSGSHS
jgi:glycosyltransferase involved in cell wall biosynthesis